MNQFWSFHKIHIRLALDTLYDLFVWRKPMENTQNGLIHFLRLNRKIVAGEVDLGSPYPGNVVLVGIKSCGITPESVLFCKKVVRGWYTARSSILYRLSFPTALLTVLHIWALFSTFSKKLHVDLEAKKSRENGGNGFVLSESYLAIPCCLDFILLSADFSNDSTNRVTHCQPRFSIMGSISGS